jgi:hypothetical protein
MEKSTKRRARELSGDRTQDKAVTLWCRLWGLILVPLPLTVNLNCHYLLRRNSRQVVSNGASQAITTRNHDPRIKRWLIPGWEISGTGRNIALPVLRSWTGPGLPVLDGREGCSRWGIIYSGLKITESLGNVTVRGVKDGKSKRGARLSTVWVCIV